MGYNIFVLKDEFRIAQENSVPALIAIKNLCGGNSNRLPGAVNQTTQTEARSFAFVSCEAVLKASNIHDALSAWRWLLLDEKDGFVEGLEFNGEKLGDEQVLFDTLAPFVEIGSFIIVAGEDGKVWRWRFDGGKCHYETGKIVFDTPRLTNH